MTESNGQSLHLSGWGNLPNFFASEAPCAQRLEFYHTPKHASWLNMVEIEIGILRSQCLDRRIEDKDTIMAGVAAWERRRGAEGSHQRMFTTEKDRETPQSLPVKES